MGRAAAPHGRCCRCRVVLGGNVLAMVPAGAGRICPDEQLHGAHGVWGSTFKADWTLEGKTLLVRARGLAKVAERHLLQSKRQPLCQDGKGHEGAQHPGSGWERPNVFSVSFTSLARFQNSVQPPLLWWSWCSSLQGSPGEELLKSNLTTIQDEQCCVWGGFRCQDQNTAVRGGSSSSPLAPAMRGPGASPAGDGVSMKAPGGFSFLWIYLATFSTQTTMESS